MGILVKVAAVIAAVAAGLMIKPEVVLMLPNGFIPYAILGHLPPAYFNLDAYTPDEFDSWAKDGDLVVATGAKCGTNWLLYMAHLIRTKGDVDKFPFEDVMYNTPWPTLRHQPGQQWPEIKEKMFTQILPDGSKLRDKWDHPDYLFRVFKSHEFPATEDGGNEVLPIRRRPKVKFLSAVRNPFDQMRSLYPFFANHNAQFRRMWGDFPPVYDNKEQLFADFTEDGPLAAIIWAYPIKWFAYKDEPNVLMFVFEDMLRDREGHVQRLADFMGIALTGAEKAKITHLTSFSEMKKIADRFDYLLWAHREHPEQKIMQPGKLLRSGEKGEGATFFTEDEKAVIQSHIDRHFPDDVQRFMGLKK